MLKDKKMLFDFNIYIKDLVNTIVDFFIEDIPDFIKRIRGK